MKGLAVAAGRGSANSVSKKATPAKKTAAKKGTPAKKAAAGKATATKTTAAKRATATKNATAKKAAPTNKSKTTTVAKKTRTRAAATVDAAAAVSSKFFKRQRDRARKLVDDPEALRRVAEDANRSGALRSGPFAAVLEDFRALIRLVVAYARGNYRDIPADALITIVAGLLYVLSPIDLIPDALAGVGLVDDVAVIGWVLKTVRSEVEAFREWELGSGLA
jgi:uncharacterized membrane protein YkvA (DUF1232 family)